jgi:hypothetical protein
MADTPSRVARGGGANLQATIAAINAQSQDRASMEPISAAVLRLGKATTRLAAV